MKYCTSCGAMSGRKICKACGVKENKEHKYCGWCGAPLNENAAVCTNCGMKVKPNRLFNVIGTIVGIFLLLIAALSSLSILAIGSIEMRISAYFIYISTLAFAGILCFPFADRQIKAAFLGKKFARQIAPLVRIVLVVVLVMVANKSYTAEKERTNIHKRQEQGIAVAKAQGVKFGRPTTEFPSDWNEVYTQWKNGEIKAVDAMRVLNLTKPTFYRLVKRHEEKA